MSGYDSIEVLKNVEGIQHRPSMYVGDVSNEEGYKNTVWEVISNAFDEHLAGYGNEVCFSFDPATRVVAVRDKGRGIPNGWNQQEERHNLDLVFTHIHSGSKFDNENYAFSSGLHGVGNTAVNALSEFLVCVSCRRERSAIATFKHGRLARVLELPGSAVTGTYVFFRLDDGYFPYHDLAREEIVRKAQGLCNVSTSLSFYLDWGGEIELIESAGMAASLREKLGEYRHVVDSPLELSYAGKEGYAQVYLDWVYSNEHVSQVYTNGVEQTQGGTHVQALIHNVRKLIKERTGQEFKANDVREGMVLGMSIMIPGPQYASQTKEKLTSPQAKVLINQLFETNNDYLVARHTAIEGVATYLRQVLKKRNEYLDSRIEKKASKHLLPGKLLDCISRDLTVNELMVTEGDSAGATAKSVRECQFQAIIPIRGKPINVEKTSLKRVLNFESIRNVVQAVGTGLGQNFDYEKLRYGKIILMSDADADGYQINALLLSLFYKYMPELLLKGHVYVASPPLYCLHEGKRNSYFANRTELERFLLKKQGIPVEVHRHYNGVCRGVMWEQKVITDVLDWLGRTIADKGKAQSGIFASTGLPCKIHCFMGHVLVTLGYRTFRNHYVFRSDTLETITELKDITGEERPFAVIHRVLNLEGYRITRLKGLGQMNEDEIWDLLIDPERRVLKQINFVEAAHTYRHFSLIMGNDAFYRKALIDNSELSIYELDV